jgi:hypothetical protein
MASEDLTVGFGKRPDFIVEHRGKRFTIVTLTPQAREWLAKNYPQILDPELPLIVGQTWAMEFLGSTYWAGYQCVVQHSTVPHGAVRA